MPSIRAGGRLLFAGASRRHRVTAPEPDRIRLFQQLRAAQEQRGRERERDGQRDRRPPGAPIRIALPGGARLPGRAWHTTPFQVATELGGGLAEAALVARVNGTLQDLDCPLEGDTDLELLDFSSPEGRTAFWLSGACVLGAAAQQLFGATFCGARATEDGFFCDVDMGDRTVQGGDLPALEEACVTFARSGHRFERLEATRPQLAQLFQHSNFQLQQLEDEVTSPTATVYRCGPILHLCPGPLLRHTGLIRALRVLTSSASLWDRGVTRCHLQRVTAIAFPHPEDAVRWQRAQDEAATRDHRRIGKEQELFFFHPLSPGSCFFLPRGAHVYNALLEFIRSECQSRGFREVVSPTLFRRALWQRSGHWQHYGPNIFPVTSPEGDDEQLSLKPMNCPAHCLMFAHRPRSWRELPLRLADFGVLHRNEPPGTLTGLTRLRRFTQDDGHIFCTPEQQLERSLRKFGQPWDLSPGDGAFYGPKIDIRIRDALGRQHQCGTIQLDFQMPERFGLEYMSAAGGPLRPVLIHRAVLGSLERLLAVLAESCGGRWPLWLSPLQVMVIPQSPEVEPYAREVQAVLRGGGLQADLDGDAGATLGRKIRRAQLAQYNFQMVVGPRERSRGTVSVRTRDNRHRGERELRPALRRLQELRDTRVPNAEELF
ncbi:threonine--tRNA ligase, mitochondrial isoform X3 [Patagioenas fasciata]|uniref:threonine--tRNA ligase, mitochondrial isoform X3 n=1 Tax=Patagioenas fasciata TaxID=372321 RepID=UPI003A990573